MANLRSTLKVKADEARQLSKELASECEEDMSAPRGDRRDAPSTRDVISEEKEEGAQSPASDGYFDLETWLVGRCDELPAELKQRKVDLSEKVAQFADASRSLIESKSKIVELEDNVEELRSKLHSYEKDLPSTMSPASSAPVTNAKMLRAVCAQRDELQRKLEGFLKLAVAKQKAQEADGKRSREGITSNCTASCGFLAATKCREKHVAPRGGFIRR